MNDKTYQPLKELQLKSKWSYFFFIPVQSCLCIFLMFFFFLLFTTPLYFYFSLSLAFHNLLVTFFLYCLPLISIKKEKFLVSIAAVSQIFIQPTQSLTILVLYFFSFSYMKREESHTQCTPYHLIQGVGNLAVVHCR